MGRRGFGLCASAAPRERSLAKLPPKLIFQAEATAFSILPSNSRYSR